MQNECASTVRAMRSNPLQYCMNMQHKKNGLEFGEARLWQWNGFVPRKLSPSLASIFIPYNSLFSPDDSKMGRPFKIGRSSPSSDCDSLSLADLVKIESKLCDAMPNISWSKLKSVYSLVTFDNLENENRIVFFKRGAI